jgi:hypothetical protein
MNLFNISPSAFGSMKSELHKSTICLQGIWLQTRAGLRLVWRLRSIGGR